MTKAPRAHPGGDVVGGPAPFAKADRSRFLQALDEALVRLGMATRGPPLPGQDGI